jgi:predicted RNase H-like nuclease (RuvC/YqgF family)
MWIQKAIIFCSLFVAVVLPCKASTASDLGVLQSKLVYLAEAVSNAEKLGDADKLAMLVIQWRDVSPMISKDLGDFFDLSAARMSADIKKYRAKSSDGSLPEKTANLYDQMTTRIQESLKNLAAMRNQMKAITEKLNETLKTVSERPEIKTLIDAKMAQKRADSTLQNVDQALRKLEAYRP